MWMDSLSVVAENPNMPCREGVGTLLRFGPARVLLFPITGSSWF